jgi:hypothetical protein
MINDTKAAAAEISGGILKLTPVASIANNNVLIPNRLLALSRSLGMGVL